MKIKNKKIWFKLSGMFSIIPFTSLLVMCKNQGKVNSDNNNNNLDVFDFGFDENMVDIQKITKAKFIEKNKAIVNLKLKKFNFSSSAITVALTYIDNDGKKITSASLKINEEQSYDFVLSNLTLNRQYQIESLVFDNQKSVKKILLKNKQNDYKFITKPPLTKIKNFNIKKYNKNVKISFNVEKNNSVNTNERIELELKNLNNDLVPTKKLITKIDDDFNVEFDLGELELNTKYQIVDIKFLDIISPNISTNIFEKLAEHQSFFTTSNIKINNNVQNTDDKQYIKNPYKSKIKLDNNILGNFNDRVLLDAFEEKNNNVQQIDGLNKNTMEQNEPELRNYFHFINRQINFKNIEFKNESFDDISKNTDQEVKFKIKNINISKDNKKATIELDSSNSNDNNKLLDASIKQLLIKSYDYNNPWSKIINYEKIANNKIQFDLNDFPKDLKTFIITHIRFDANVVSLGKIKDNSFEYNQNNKKYSLKSVKYYLDTKQNQLYGSAHFDFSDEDFSILKNKTFIFKYKIDNKNDVLKNYIPLNKYIRVDFKKLAQFKIFNVFDGLNYVLESIEIVNKDSLLPYNSNISIENVNNTNFSIWHNNYSKQDIVDLFYDKTKTSDNFNLSKVDIDHLWKNNNSNNNISYSLRNLVSLSLHHREYEIYKNNASNSFYQYNTTIVDKNFKLLKNDQNTYKLNSLVAHLEIKDEGLKNDAFGSFFLEKDLNDFDNLNKIKSEDVVFNVDLELDPNLIYESQLVNKNMRRSHVIIPISYKLIKEHNILEDVEFSLSYVLGSETYESHIYEQIKSQLKFNVFLNGSKIKIEVKPRNNNIKLYDYVWKHNNSNEPSYFIGRYDFVVNWLTNNDNKNIIDKKLEVFKKKSYTTRILKDNENEMSKTAIKQIRERTITFSLTSDGTWNFLGKVKPNDPNDYRYYLLTDHHVIGSGGSWYNPQLNWAGKITYESIKKNKKTIYDDDGNEKYTYSNFADYTAVIPQTITQNDLNKDKFLPYYNYSSVNNDDTPGKSQLQYFAFPFKLKFEKVMDFCLQKNPIYKHYNALGRNDDNINELDWSVVSIDLKPIFEAFKNQDLNKPFIYDKKTLTPEETSVIKYFLNLKNMKPLEVSPQTRYAKSNQDVDWYIGTFPRYTNTNQNSMGVGQLRYREYNIHKIDSVNLNFVTGGKDILYKSDIPYTTISTNYIDAAGGSSGTSLYDNEGKFVGSIATGRTPRKNGGPTWETIGWSLIDSQISGFFGDRDNKANNTSIIQQIKQLAYLYPEKYEDIYK